MIPAGRWNLIRILLDMASGGPFLHIQSMFTMIAVGSKLASE